MLISVWIALLFATPALGGVLDLFKRSSSQDSVAALDDPHSIRGLPDHLVSKFLQDQYVCDQGRTVLKSSSVNDGYCDCSDETDEPGTSACTRGTFHCRNKGYKVIRIPSSRVDDGVCDCCDGSDESTSSGCGNTCTAAAERERHALDSALQSFKTGSAQRRQWELQAKQKVETEASQEPHLRREIELVKEEESTVQGQIDERLASFHTADPSLQVQDNKSRLDELLLVGDKSTEFLQPLVQQLCDLLDISAEQVRELLSFPAPSEVNAHHHADDEENPEFAHEDVYGEVEFSEDSHCAIPSSSVLSVLCQSPLTISEELYHVLHRILTSYRPYTETFYLIGHYQLQNNVWLEHEASEFARQLLDSEHPTSSGPLTCPAAFGQLPTEFCVFPETMRALLEPLVEASHGQETDSELVRLRETLAALQRRRTQDLESRLQTAQKAVSRLQGQDTGSSLPWALQALEGQCFETSAAKFSYKVCLFSQVTQKEEHGNFNSVTLGNYNHWSSPAQDSQSSNQTPTTYTLHFENGQYCHAHGARRAEVSLKCGAQNVLKSASEPATCAYALVMESPAACTDEYAQLAGIGHLL